MLSNNRQNAVAENLGESPVEAKRRGKPLLFLLLNQDSTTNKPMVEIFFVSCCKSAMVLFKIRILCEFLTRFWHVLTRFHPEEGEYGFSGSRAPSGEQAPYLQHHRQLGLWRDLHLGILFDCLYLGVHSIVLQIILSRATSVGLYP